MNRSMTVILFAVGLLLVAGCSLRSTTTDSRRSDVPLYDGMGAHHRTITTSSSEAQRYFDQGLVWTFAFNHDEAIRSFEKVAHLDPDCAMAWWGIALCNGPHINNPVVPPERSKAAWRALQEALARKDKADPKECRLIDALAKRYADPAPKDRAPLERAYSEAMHDVWLAHRDDSDIGTLYAESMMDLRPWDLWMGDGRPQPGTDEILATLEEVMRLDPKHPGANHLYIHAVESSPHPEKGNAAADRLRRLVPASGHLVHMPSHIDVLTGRWALAARQNVLAIAADEKYLVVSPSQGFYRLYMVHNHHMLAFASMMEGNGEVAMKAARQVVESVPPEELKRSAAMLDPYMGAIYDTYKRFGRWDDMLAAPAPPKILPITTALWRFNRGVAYAAKGDLKGAEREQQAFLAAARNLPDDAVMAINPAAAIMEIAQHFLAGEMAFRRGSIDESVAQLRQAIALEDELLYMEPPEWVQPVRHTLGAVLLTAGRHKEAEEVYRQDLQKWPENGWSLYGLSRCLRAAGQSAEAAKVEARFQKVWSRPDVPIESSCLCIPKT